MNKTRILWAVIAFLCFWACNDDVVSEQGIGNLDDQGTYLDVVIESGTSSRVMYAPPRKIFITSFPYTSTRT